MAELSSVFGLNSAQIRELGITWNNLYNAQRADI